MYLEMDGKGALYGQLTRALKSAVMAGRVAPGSRLPATRELADELRISRNTVRSAYDQLIAEGFFEGRAGSGSFVAHNATTSTGTRPAASVAPQSRYARRLRALDDFRVIRLHRGLRFNLQYGEAVVDPIAITAWRRELAHAALGTALQYPLAQGLQSLREALCDYLKRRRGINCSPDDVLIVSATQQAMSLTAQVLVDPADTVVLEDPHYFFARHVFKAYGANIATVPVDQDGLQCAKLARLSPKLIVVTPSHQFPSGCLMSKSRRLELLNYAEKKKCWIFEDDYDSEFRYDVNPMPALSAIDATGRVIYAGTFSKVLFPSLRMGYLVVPPALRNDFIVAKRMADLGCPAIEQAAMARYIASGGFERHLRRVVQITKRRRTALLEGLARVGQGQFEVQDSHAGMHLVARLPQFSERKFTRLIELAAARGLGLHRSAPFYTNPPKVPGLLLGFAALSATEINAAMAVLEGCLKELNAAPVGRTRGGKAGGRTI